MRLFCSQVTEKHFEKEKPKLSDASDNESNENEYEFIDRPYYTKPKHEDQESPKNKSVMEMLKSTRTTLGRAEFNRIWQYTKPQVQWLTLGFGCMIISTGTSMILPAAFGRIIDVATVQFSVKFFEKVRFFFFFFVLRD